MRSNLILALCLLFLIHYFFNLQWVNYMVFVLAILAFVGSVSRARRATRIIGSTMMGLGFILEISKGSAIQGLSDGFLLIMPLICLITLSPLLALPLKLSGYFKSVDVLLRTQLHHPSKLFGGITGTLYLLTPILNLGSIRIIHEFLSGLKLPAVVTAKSYLIGFTSAVFWSPYFASVSLVLMYLEIPLSSYILYGLVLSLVSIGIGNLFFLFSKKKHLIAEDSYQPVAIVKKEDKKNIIRLGGFVCILMVVSLFLEYLTKWSMVVIVSLVSVVVPFLYGGLTGRLRELIPHVKVYRDQTIPMMSNEFLLFLSAGLLAHGIQGTSFARATTEFLTSIASHSFLLFSVCILGIIFFATYIGIHQIAVIAALAMQLDASALGASDISLAILLLLAWAVTTAISPFSGLNLMVSTFTGKNGFETGIRANGLHMAVLAVVGIGLSLILS